MDNCCLGVKIARLYLSSYMILNRVKILISILFERVVYISNKRMGVL